MYIYIDESGNFGWPLKSGSEPFMLFSVLVIEDQVSKRCIAQTVSRTIVDLRKHHPSCKKDSDKRIAELKGSKELADRRDVRLRFFKRIVKKANFHIYAIILDKRVLGQKIPPDYMQRYAMLLLNILCSISIPKTQRWVTMVVDSQAKADPTQPVKPRYFSKNQRLRQKRLRKQDIKRSRQYTQMITSVFKRVLKSRGTHLHVWHTYSHEDRCLQASDVIAHFMYQGLRLKEDKKKLFEGLSYGERRPSQLRENKRWQKINEELDGWYETWGVLKPRIAFVRWPKRLFRRRADILVKYASQLRQARKRGNREA